MGAVSARTPPPGVFRQGSAPWRRTVCGLPAPRARAACRRIQATLKPSTRASSHATREPVGEISPPRDSSAATQSAPKGGLPVKNKLQLFALPLLLVSSAGAALAATDALWRDVSESAIAASPRPYAPLHYRTVRLIAAALKSALSKRADGIHPGARRRGRDRAADARRRTGPIPRRGIADHGARRSRRSTPRSARIGAKASTTPPPRRASGWTRAGFHAIVLSSARNGVHRPLSSKRHRAPHRATSSATTSAATARRSSAASAARRGRRGVPVRRLGRMEHPRPPRGNAAHLPPGAGRQLRVRLVPQRSRCRRCRARRWR